MDRKPDGLRKVLARREGQSLVEFAIILPLLLLLVATIVDFGFLFYDHVATQAAAREGGRVLIQAYNDGTAVFSDAQIKAVIKQAHGPVNQIQDSEITVTTASTTEFGTPAKTGRTIEINHAHPWIMPVMIPFGSSIQIRARIKAFLVPGLTRI